MKQDSRGFTLIELIVVIAILSVMTAVISISTSVLPATRAKSCASAINTTLDRARVGSLTHAQVSYMTISQNSSGSYEIVCYDNKPADNVTYSGGTEISRRTISGGGVSVSYKDGSNTLSIVNNVTNSAAQVNLLTISFTRSGALAGGIATDTSGSCLITVTSSGGRSYTITVVGATGNHEIT